MDCDCVSEGDYGVASNSLCSPRAPHCIMSSQSMKMMRMMIPIDEISDVFHDLIPISPDEGVHPVCTIDYPTSFRIAHDYLRACFKNHSEKSERALKLSATCLKLNPANYTIWHYRRACMEALGYFSSGPAVAKEKIQQDLNLASQLGGDNPKNYQIWYHRRALLDAFNTLVVAPPKTTATTTAADMVTLESEFLVSELDYIAQVLTHDTKNYHAWSHRQWLIQTVNQPEVFDQELLYSKLMHASHELLRVICPYGTIRIVPYIHTMHFTLHAAATLIQEDPRNNSAWNQRWFAVHRSIHNQPLTLEKCKEEAEFAIVQGATVDPYNESPFRYLIGLFQEQQQSAALAAEFYPKVENLQRVLEEAQRDPNACTNWTSARIDLLEYIGDDSSISQAIILAEGMATRYDIIRKRYWKHRIHLLQGKIASAMGTYTTTST
jgi:protein farnesyltransferase/geranylgeranyltransferase type-1 subunit alpha